MIPGSNEEEGRLYRTPGQVGRSKFGNQEKEWDYLSQLGRESRDAWAM